MVQFSQEVFDQICERIAEGESLRSICKNDDMPSVMSVMRWLAADDKLSDQYARAREIQGDREFDEAREIAFSATPEDVQVARLKYEAVRWRAGKLRPKVYGDKLDVNAKGVFSVVIGDDDAKL